MRGQALAWGVALAAALAGPALAHPHVFVDAGVELRFDEAGALSSLRIVWVYDDLTSMMILADRGLPIDRDLTADEAAALAGFDMNWDAGFEGDSYLLLGDTGIGLGGPESWTAQVSQGRIVTSHVRRPDRPVPAQDAPLILQIYDPTYYTSYAIVVEPVIRGREDCAAEIYGPDLEAASEHLASALEELMGQDPETDFPAVGAWYSDEVRVQCPKG